MRHRLCSEFAKQSAAAGAAGLAGPIGTYLYGKATIPDEEKRYALMGRAALGGSLGGLLGTATGIPIAMATGIPVLPGMLLSSGLGMLGSGVGAAVAARRYQKSKQKKRK